MFIRPNQIRAARGLLDWTVANLAAKVGVGTTTVSAIETGRSAGSLEVLTGINYAFRTAGIELTEDGGVRPSQSHIVIYRDHDGFRSFFDDIYEVAKSHSQADICLANVKEEQFDHWLGSYESIHTARMISLKNVKLRVLMKEADLNLTSTAYCSYRWIPKKQFADVSLYIYGDKVAFIEFQKKDVTVTVVDNKAVTDCQRKMFEVSWDSASKKPAS